MASKKNSRNKTEVSPKLQQPEPNSGETPVRDGPDLFWLINCFLVIAVSVFLRFYWLELKPLHHDEGVNGHFLTRLFRDGFYQYDPSNYHGPDLYYISLAFTKVFGLNTLSVRWSVAVFGVLTVILALFLKRWIGRTGALAAGLLLALSPGMVFISRYFIHEILFVFFSLAIVVSVLYFIEKKRAGVFAAGWMALLLMVCFLPPALRLPEMVFASSTWQWVFGIVIFAFESFLVFLVMRMLMAWDGGRAIYLFLAAASLILLFATKETGFITVGTLLIAWLCVRMWQWISSSGYYESRRGQILGILHAGLFAAAAVGLYRYYDGVKEFYGGIRDFFTGPSVPDQAWIFYSVIFLVAAGLLTWVIFLASDIRDSERADLTPEPAEPSWKAFRSALGSRIDVILIAAGCVFVIIYVGILFFSSFFTYPRGVVGFFEAYAIWTKTGSKDHTQNGTMAYFRWLMEIEAPILVLSVLGSAIAVIRARNRFAMFAGLWAFGLLLGYTIIPYKTPWLALSFILPMCIVAGYGAGQLIGSKSVVLKILGGSLSVAAAGVLAYQSYDINFVRYDSDRMPYIYAHTQRGFEDLMKEVKRVAEVSGKGREASVDIVSPDYWPMPWYLNDYPNAVFHGGLTDSSQAEMIIASKIQIPELDARYGSTHRVVGSWPLRPGVELYLLVRNDIESVE